jgi:hypothetical protein
MKGEIMIAKKSIILLVIIIVSISIGPMSFAMQISSEQPDYVIYCDVNPIYHHPTANTNWLAWAYVDNQWQQFRHRQCACGEQVYWCDNVSPRIYFHPQDIDYTEIDGLGRTLHYLIRHFHTYASAPLGWEDIDHIV